MLTKLIFLAPKAFQEAPFLHFWDFTIFVVFVATASPSNMITLKLANRSLFMITNFSLKSLSTCFKN